MYMKLKTKKTICLLIGIASILAIVSTVSYAYFTASGEVKKLEATISTGTANAKFMDNDTGIIDELQFGESITKKFTIQNTGTVEARVKMYWKDLVNTYTPETLTYTLSQSETLEGPYTEIVAKTNVPKKNELLVDSLTIPVGETYYYNLVITLNYLEDVNQDADLSAIFSSTFRLEDIKHKSITEQIIASSNGVRTTFDSPATTDEGIFEMEDDYGTSYYYRGAVENNYVKFGQNKSGQDMYWRIVRLNGDGTLRIIYDGTSAHANGESNSDRLAMTGVAWNFNMSDALFVGYMFGWENGSQTNQNASNIKTQVDTWYKENIVDTGYGDAVSDEIFCNDRSFAKDNTGTGFGTNTTYYGVKTRFTPEAPGYTNANPTLKCPQKVDAFTMNDSTTGNRALTYPVGLLTADEVSIAGGMYSSSGVATNNSYYLYKGFWYWLLSPYYYQGGAYMLVFYPNGYLYLNYVTDRGGVAPVINLSAEYVDTLIGEGTMESPYRAA